MHLDSNTVLIAAMMHPAHAQEVASALNASVSPASAAPVVDGDVIDVLDGIKGFYGTNDCWCDSEGDATHFGHCIKARALWERLKQSSAAATAAPQQDHANTCKRAFPCRYSDARQCARDTMLGSECPKVCECSCHATAAPVGQSIDPIGDFVDQVWKLTNDRDGWSRMTLRGVVENFARQFTATPSSTSASAAPED